VKRCWGEGAHVDVYDGACSMRRDSDAVDLVEDSAGSVDIFLKRRKDGGGISEYVDSLGSADRE